MTELQVQFRPPRDGPAVSTRLRDYATAEEIGGVVAALQLSGASSACRRGGAKRTATSRMSAAAQDAPLAAMWAAADRRRVGWILGYLREGVVHSDYRDHAGLLPEGPARELLPRFYARYEAAQAAALEFYVKRGPRPRSTMLLAGAAWHSMVPRMAASARKVTVDLETVSADFRAAEPVSRYSPGIFRGSQRKAE